MKRNLGLAELYVLPVPAVQIKAVKNKNIRKKDFHKDKIIKKK